MTCRTSGTSTCTTNPNHQQMTTPAPFSTRHHRQFCRLVNEDAGVATDVSIYHSKSKADEAVELSLQTRLYICSVLPALAMNSSGSTYSTTSTVVCKELCQPISILHFYVSRGNMELHDTLVHFGRPTEISFFSVANRL